MTKNRCPCAQCAQHDRDDLQADLLDRLRSLAEGVTPSHGTPQELQAALRDAREIVEILRRLSGEVDVAT